MRAPPAETQYVEVEGETLYDVEDILDERTSRGVGQYLVQWEGIDPATGKAWDPTWEPKTSCSDQLIADWKAKKRKDPRIVGRWTRKMQQRLKEEKKAKAGGKRKREGSSSTHSAGDKSPKRTKGSGKPFAWGMSRPSLMLSEQTIVGRFSTHPDCLSRGQSQGSVNQINQGHKLEPRRQPRRQTSTKGQEGRRRGSRRDR